MKLRIKGNSIRLRLTQGEVQRIGAGQEVREEVGFGTGTFAYTLTVDASIPAVDAQFYGQEIQVRIPAGQATAWAHSDQVGMEESVPGSEGQWLHVLIEKDFQCLHQRPNEDESDHFKNPAAVEE